MASLMSSSKGGNRFRLYFNVFFAAIVAFRYEKKMRSAPLPDKPSGRGLFGLPEGTGAAPMTGAPAAHCFVHSPRPEPRGLYGVATRYIMGTTWFSIGL